MGAGLRKLREVHPGVPLLNRQFAAVVHRFAVLQTKCRITKTTMLRNCKKVGRAFAALRRKSKGSTDYSFACLPIAKTFEKRVI